ncbi:MAG: winged helix-turn-helix transcriptional regulator [Thermodesulfobacteriota bacterium]
MTSPKPGTPARGSQTGRPIMVLLDLLGRRWALRILWELHQSGPNSFRTLQKRCGDISPTVLNARLSELREAGIVELRDGEGYVITAEGVTLGGIIGQLNAWAKRWVEHSVSASGPQPTGKTSPRGKTNSSTP